MKLYVAGPMRGIKDFNFPAFDQAADELRRRGHEVCNPADKDRETHGEDVNKSETGDLADIAATGFNLRETLSWDLQWIAANADGIAVLPGWEHSKGATAEVALALALGLLVLPWDSFGDADWHDSAQGQQWAVDAAFLGQITSIPARDVLVDTKRATGEVRSVSATGGEKGVKLARFDLIPSGALWQVAEVMGAGALKYADRNWERGYEWSKSKAALQRHLELWWQGEDFDDECSELAGKPIRHLANVAWHALVLIQFASEDRYADFDDRPIDAVVQALEVAARRPA